MLPRELYLARVDQSVAAARTTLREMVSEYGDHMTAIENTNDDEMDVVCSLIEHLAHGQIDRPTDRVHFLATMLAVATKMFYDENH